MDGHYAGTEQFVADVQLQSAANQKKAMRHCAGQGIRAVIGAMYAHDERGATRHGAFDFTLDDIEQGNQVLPYGKKLGSHPAADPLCTEHWVTKTDKVQVGDLERTIIDGLKQSEYCGGFTEVAKGFWMRRDDIDHGKLVDYALRLNVGSVIRRLGFLLEAFEVDAPRELERLQQKLTATYATLDPLLPDEGQFAARWRLRLNVDPLEIVSVVRT